jgi:glutamate dehydrogenase
MAAQYASEHGKYIRNILAQSRKDGAVKKAFIREFYAPITLQVLAKLAPKRGYELASYCFDAIKKKKPQTPIVHIHEQTLCVDELNTKRIRLIVANDDMPFLVDSIALALNKLHVKALIMLHPVVQVKRTPAGVISGVNARQSAGESFIYVELAPLPKGLNLAKLRQTLLQVLNSVRVCVQDWHSMENAIEKVLQSDDVAPEKMVGEEAPEIKDFIRWLHDRNFVFLGHASYVPAAKKNAAKKGSGKNGAKKSASVPLVIDSKKSLGLYRLNNENDTAIEYSNQTIGKTAITITKASNMAIVHRNAHMDLVVIKHFAKDGGLRSETRFLGLFTSNVYYQSAIQIPIIRLKIGRVLMRAGYKPTSHSGKALRTIFEFLPRDEVFLMSEDALFDIGMGVLAAEAYPQVRLFIRHDPFNRFVSALVYIPKERFSSDIRETITAMLQTQLHATIDTLYAQISDSPLARLHVVLDTQGKRVQYDLQRLENTIAALVNNWADGLHDALLLNYPKQAGEALAARYGDAFPNTYIYGHDAVAAGHDIRKIESCLHGDGIELEVFKTKKNNGETLHLKCFTRDTEAALSDIFPLLENMGLSVCDVLPYTIMPAGACKVLLRDFSLTLRQKHAIDLVKEKARIEDAMHQIWRGKAANDSLNALLFLGDLTWRDIAILRAYVRYLQQINFPYRLGYMARVLTKHQAVTSLIVQLFHAKFAPKTIKRTQKMARLHKQIHAACESIANLAEDRILRRIVALIDATLRTNFFITDAAGDPLPYISYKFASAKIPELPLPRPYAEIFVTSGQTEGIHLRGDKVARGGLRWSDRAEDFRTEVLGLVKAQMVKNAVIVPEGAKGGFVVRRPPEGRDAMQKQGIICYKEFLSGLLDITDNIVNGKVVPPKQVVRYDDDDPYLVVAADKGTATFSDIANDMADQYGFWLGDAFASGGSVGYDHKVMGITARGAWVSVERHFKEMGHNIDKQTFTAIGIGDMSGDVFGNGMLLSKNCRLIAGFNHRHIFMDPNPDAASTYKERKRLFKLPRSGWNDYDLSKISAGGGVFDRSAKSINLSKQMRQMLDTDATSLAPDELIKLILKARVDLLWNGGIGTYVKACSETHDQIGDRSNNGLRINGNELRCKIVGEGGNLGMSQLGRIEYAKKGGRINTDAIDNSAGVDCSDHEVNIKIALNAALTTKKLTNKTRNKLLKEMTQEVGDLVLNDNRLQTQAISIAEHEGPAQIDSLQQLMHGLEDENLLDREVEFLPDDKQLEEMRVAKMGPTRPVLSVLLAYSKLALYRDLKKESQLDDGYFTQDLLRYFPGAFLPRFKPEMMQHRLRREIIATMITNSIINRTGITFAHELRRETGLKNIHVALSYVAVRDMFGLRDIWTEIESLDSGDLVQTQMQLFDMVNQFIAHHCRWLLQRYGVNMNIAGLVTRFRSEITKLEKVIEKSLSKTLDHSFKTQRDSFIEAGVPEALANRMARMEAMRSALDIIEISADSHRTLAQISTLYFELGSRLRLGWLRKQARAIPAETYWQRQAVTTLKNELYAAQRRVAQQTLGCFSKKPSNYCLEQWCDKHADDLARYQRVISEIELLSSPDFATLTVALRQVQAVTG